MEGRVAIGFKLPNCGGVLCPPEWAEPANLHDLSARADRLGFESVWLHDHQVTPRELRHLGALRFYEPLITMATLAQAFPRLRIGIATVVLPLRDPVLLAKQIGTLDAFFPGRLIFGMGAGRYESEFQAVGVDLFAERGRVSKEYLEIIGALRDGDGVTYEGTYRRLADASMHPQSADPRRSPVWYAGNSRVAAERAGRLSDGWIGAAMEPGELAGVVEPMLGARATADRGPSDFTIALSATVERPRATGTDDAGAETLHQHASTITGSPGQIAERLNAFVRVGVTHFLLSLRADEIERLHDDMEWFATEVMPLLDRQSRTPAVEAALTRKDNVG